jgi:uncharacterized membrane protein
MKHFTRKILTMSIVTLLLIGLLHVSCAAATAIPAQPQSPIPIATAVIIIITIATAIAVLGFVIIRKGEKP